MGVEVKGLTNDEKIHGAIISYIECIICNTTV